MPPYIIISFWQSQCLLTEPSNSHVKYMQLTPEIAISHTSSPCENLIFQQHGNFAQPGHTPLLKSQKMSHGTVSPILNLVNQYDQWTPSRMPKKALQHEAKVNTSPKLPKLNLCVTATQSWKTPRTSHQSKHYASAYILSYDVVFSRFGAFNTVLSYIKYVTQMKIFPLLPNQILFSPIIFFWNTP